VQSLPYLIIGQGLAGSMVALSLLERDAQVVVADDGHPQAPSRITPGLATPIAGPRLTFPPSGAAAVAASWQRWRHLECRFRRRLLYRHEILHAAGGREELQQYHRRLAESAFASWLGPAFTPGAHDGLLADPWGGFTIHGGLVDVPAFLRTVDEHLRSTGSRIDRRIEPQELRDCGDHAEVGGAHYQAVIFCDGPAGQENPWLSGIGLQRIPGEVLTVAPAYAVEPYIFHGRAGYLAPHPGHRGHFRLGATYGAPDTPARVTDAAREHLLGQLPRLLSRPPHMEVVDHQAGARPATPQRAPVLGRLPERPAAVLNGLGARAMLQAPYLAEALAEHLLTDAPIPEGCLAPASA